MIAEINNKISSKLANSEDLLTGNFFGTLRYTNIENTIPCVFKACKFNNSESKNIFNLAINDINTSGDPFVFWPRNEGDEIDLIIELGDFVIGVEIKLNSGLSSDDDIVNDEINKIDYSKNQLSRYSFLLKRKYPNKRCILLFLAKEDVVSNIYYSVLKRNIINSDVLFGYLSWQNILESLECYKPSNNELLIIKDLIQYLTKKGFDTFKSFVTEQEVNSDLFFNFSFIERFSFLTQKQILKLAYEYE